ncbi:MAG: aldehyde ferredoxin oxidoreductase family protein [Spirochaetaceae bacterium]|nr:MAG: aldehyde ferredoxin oxidoreductase family protein [Spirochaetaceae bacterium]
MRFNGGYLGRILRINLSTRTSSQEPLKELDLLKLLGGRGLAAKYYYEEIGPQVRPLGEENKLIFMTGPLTGLRLPSTPKFQLATKSPNTGIYLCANSSGQFGPYLKRCGFDGLIIEGSSKDWIYVSIVDEKVSFHAADRLVGFNNSAAQKALKQTLEIGPASALTIGPAGEKLVHLACINVDARFFGRGGAGAVMGSKKLKGIVIQGTGTIPVADPHEVQRIFREGVAMLKDSRASHTEYGTAQFVEVLNELGCIPTRNFQSSYFEGADKVDAHAMVEHYKEKNSACYMCTIACGQVNRVKEGPFSGARARTEYETVVMLGPNCGVDDFAAIVQAAELCDELGIDTISTGNAVALTMELFEKGLISKEDTGGIEARFGNGQAMIDLIRMIAARRGIGALLADGMKIVAEKHPQWRPYIIAVKGLPFAAYDPRGFHGKALTFGTASRGACHNVGGWTVRHELISKEYDRFAVEGKGKLVKTIQDNRGYVDSTGVCTVARSSMGFTDNPKGNVLEAVTGYDFTPALLEIGERIYNLERVILNREGIRRDDDQLPERIMKDPVQTGPCKGKVVTFEMYNIMLDEYYNERGWDEDGQVKEETLAACGLPELLNL